MKSINQLNILANQIEEIEQKYAEHNLTDDLKNDPERLERMKNNDIDQFFRRFPSIDSLSRDLPYLSSEENISLAKCKAFIDIGNNFLISQRDRVTFQIAIKAARELSMNENVERHVSVYALKKLERYFEQWRTESIMTR